MLGMLAQYGNNGGGSGGGGGTSYGPAFWLIVVAAVVILVALGTWFLRSRKSRAANSSAETASVGKNERAA